MLPDLSECGCRQLISSIGGGMCLFLNESLLYSGRRYDTGHASCPDQTSAAYQGVVTGGPIKQIPERRDFCFYQMYAGWLGDCIK